MRAAAELSGFATLATALLLAAFSLRPAAPGAEAAGAGGEALVSLEASTAAIEEMVKDWETPPDIETPTIEMPDLPALEAPQMPELPQIALAAPAPLPMTSALPPPSLSKLPTIAPPPPPPPPKPVVQQPDTNTPRAQARPERTAKPALRKEPPKKGGAISSAKQRAAGSGGGTTAGAASTANAATLAPSKVKSLKAGWGAAIRSRIDRRKRYPRAAGGASGTVGVRLAVNSNGQLAGLSITRSSGTPALDQAALAAVKAAARFPRAPKGIANGNHAFTLQISFAR